MTDARGYQHIIIDCKVCALKGLFLDTAFSCI
jgi:hypothetical protein